ncbi:MAG: hypothetical protein M1819_004371 [Sarea resinae]|nr:MAG: hypothetical protein M1819_004371 [Sarea resinae]
MATSAPQIPRFLLPRLTWQPTISRPAGLTALALQSAAATANGKPPSPASSSTSPMTTPTSMRTYSSQQHHRQQATRQAFRRPNLAQISYHHNHHHPTIPRVSLSAAFHTSAPLARDHHFDTLKFVKRLKGEGFSEEQAVAMMRVLGDVIDESIQNLTRTMVLREDQEKATYTQKVDFAKLRSELLSADTSESSLTRASHERLTNDLAKLNSRLRDEISRTQASVRLDLNLEKGRIREEANVQELKIKETETRIEQEVAGLRERVEGVKFSTLQWLM